MLTELKIPRNNAAAKWLTAEVSNFNAGIVTSLVPNRFDAYVRIFHPAGTSNDTPVRWSEVADAVGGQMHARVQWHTLVGASDPGGVTGSKWPGCRPSIGDLDCKTLAALCSILSHRTTRSECCFFGLWEGWGRKEYRELWNCIGGLKQTRVMRHKHGVVGPRFGVPRFAGRDYLLLCGPLRAAVEMVDAGLTPASPNYIWPADRAWFVTTDIDLDSTFVGGTEELVNAILDSKEIEAWRVGPSDSLTIEADHLNAACG